MMGRSQRPLIDEWFSHSTTMASRIRLPGPLREREIQDASADMGVEKRASAVSEPASVLLYPQDSVQSALCRDAEKWRINATQADTPVSKGSTALAKPPDTVPTSDRNAWLRKQVGLELDGHILTYVAKWAGLQYQDDELFKTDREIREYLDSEPLYNSKTKKWTELFAKSVKLEQDLYVPLEKILVAILETLTKIPSPNTSGTAEDVSDPETCASDSNNAPDSDSCKTSVDDGNRGSDDFTHSSLGDEFDDPKDSDYVPDPQDVPHIIVGPDGTRELRRGDDIHFMHMEDLDTKCDQYSSPDFVIRATGPSFEIPPHTSDVLRALGYTNIATFIEVKLGEVPIKALIEQVGVYARYVFLIHIRRIAVLTTAQTDFYSATKPQVCSMHGHQPTHLPTLSL